MRGLIIPITSLFILVQCASPEMVTEEEVLNVLETWRQSYLKRDTVLLTRVLDDQWIYSGSIDGTLSTKPQAIKELSEADYRFLDIYYYDMKVHVFDNIGIIRGKEKMTILGAAGDTTLVKLSFTDVYIKTGGITKAISTHSSPLR